MDVDFDKGLRHCDGNRQIYQAVLQQYQQQYAQGLSFEQLSADSHEASIRELHTLKGLSATIGADELSALAKQLQLDWPTLSPPQQRERLDIINQMLARVIAYVNEWR
ncbi:Hpt domain-containing protein [Idiomarina tyrosinivorans]|uniref:Hpt domain-containing protein n=1 Tax=Idiomarina tyrosinivorans TaxID=1445662 RepID=A0A432ZR03_9GAMM|nr:Hpt domain-containing protein [Idiomarina tyrosinivorans]RUO80344.1 Hpt domain-containing protein [Idiomarina tyrosinivorans]